MQQIEKPNEAIVADLNSVPAEGRLLAIDPGKRRVGVAICDELRITTRPLETITVESWKKLLKRIKELVAELDAKALVIGLPLESDGSDSIWTTEVRDTARKFALSLDIPVLLQDERMSSFEAQGRLWSRGVDTEKDPGSIDSEAAAIILSDLLDRLRMHR